MKECIVKRRSGVCQAYDPKKVYGSVYAACYAVHRKDTVCEKRAEKVMKKVSAFLKRKKKVTSHEVQKKLIAELRKIDKEAAFLYDTHMDIN